MLSRILLRFTVRMTTMIMDKVMVGKLLKHEKDHYAYNNDQVHHHVFHTVLMASVAGLVVVVMPVVVVLVLVIMRAVPMSMVVACIHVRKCMEEDVSE